MDKHHLRWLLFVMASLVLAGAAGLKGFYGFLWSNDATSLGACTIALYAACTAWIGWQIRQGEPDLWFVAKLAALMSYLGILGTFIGLAIAFQAMAHLPADGTIPASFKAEFLKGVSTKFLTSIVGLVCSMLLGMQIAILKAGQRP